MPKLVKITALGALCSFLSFEASAQDDMFDRDRVVGAGDRYHADYQPKPVRAGTWIVNPSLGIGAEYSENVYAAADNEESDTILRLQPRVTARSDWNRHFLEVDVRADHREYLDLSAETHTQFKGGLRGRLDITRDWSANANAGAQQLYHQRGEAGAADGVLEPTKYNLVYAGGGLQFQRERVELRVGTDFRDYGYDDLKLANGGIRDQSYRDHLRSQFDVRAAYAVSPDIAVYVRGEVAQRDFDNLSPNAINFDTDSLRGEVGVSVQLPQLVRADVAIGYMTEERSDASLNDTDSFVFDADLTWLPTELTKITAGASRYTAETGQGTSPSALMSEFSVRADHELKRNILVFGRAVFRDETYEEIGAVSPDRTYTQFGIGGTYKLNPNAHFQLELENRSRDGGDNPSADYDQNLVNLTVKLYP